MSVVFCRDNQPPNGNDNAEELELLGILHSFCINTRVEKRKSCPDDTESYSIVCVLPRVLAIGWFWWTETVVVVKKLFSQTNECKRVLGGCNFDGDSETVAESVI